MSSPLTITPKDHLSAHLILTSCFENIEVAERALLDLCAEANCRSEDEYWIVTALREAMANAVRHGNRQDPERQVEVHLSIHEHRVEIRIDDQGEGFDLAEVPDPTTAENLLRPSGRGIFYMRQFMNSVEFHRTPTGGTSVVMVRELTPPTKE